jgi:hypothetical protein
LHQHTTLILLLLIVPLNVFSLATAAPETGAFIAVTADYGSPTLVNTLSIGTEVTRWFEMYGSRMDANSTFSNKIIPLHIKLIRVFATEDLQPCTYWNSTSRSGTYSWSNFDKVVSFIYRVGAEPLLNLDAYDKYLCMQVNANTQLADSQSFATYAADIAAHAVSKGWQIKYWEVLNEPQYVMSNPPTQNQLSQVVGFFNVVAARIHQTLPNALVGLECTRKAFFDYVVKNAQGMGFLSFHKYDTSATLLESPQYYLSDQALLSDASDIGQWGEYYMPDQLRQMWNQTHGGQAIPIICSETNLNSAYANGADPRIQETIGAVWYAEELRAFILAGIQYSVYYELASDEAVNWPPQPTPNTRGAGFGMMNSTSPYTEWYPYWTNYIFGNNLNVGDMVVNSQSTNSTALSTIAWHSQNQYVLIMISKIQYSFAVNVTLAGLPAGAATQLSVFTVNSDSPTLQSSSLPYQQKMPFTMNGYSVVAVIATS